MASTISSSNGTVQRVNPAMARIYMEICLTHRGRYGINRPTRVNDCSELQCKKGCPLTPARLQTKFNVIDKELQAKWRKEDMKASLDERRK